jgi:hypothetical protein
VHEQAVPIVVIRPWQRTSAVELVVVAAVVVVVLVLVGVVVATVEVDVVVVSSRHMRPNKEVPASTVNPRNELHEL